MKKKSYKKRIAKEVIALFLISILSCIYLAITPSILENLETSYKKNRTMLIDSLCNTVSNSEVSNYYGIYKIIEDDLKSSDDYVRYKNMSLTDDDYLDVDIVFEEFNQQSNKTSSFILYEVECYREYFKAIKNSLNEKGYDYESYPELGKSQRWILWKMKNSNNNVVDALSIPVLNKKQTIPSWEVWSFLYWYRDKFSEDYFTLAEYGILYSDFISANSKFASRISLVADYNIRRSLIIFLIIVYPIRISAELLLALLKWSVNTLRR